MFRGTEFDESVGLKKTKHMDSVKNSLIDIYCFIL